MTHWDDGTIRFKNKGSGQRLNANSARVGSDTCNDSEAQSWY